MNNAQKYITSEFDIHLEHGDRSFKPQILIWSANCSGSRHISITWEQLEQIKQLLIDTSESE